MVCDGLIFEIVLRGTDAEGWFQEEAGVCRLSALGHRKTLELWARRLDAHASGDVAPMRDLFRREALAIERHVLGADEYRPNKKGS